MKLTVGRLLLLLVVIGLVVAVVMALQPSPIAVDMVSVTVGHMEVTVDEDGKTRVRDRYVVSAPLNGKLRRIGLRVGNEVQLAETILAVIEPIDPALLDRRQLATTNALVKAAESAVEKAETAVRQAEADLELARLEMDRAEKLLAGGGGTKQQLETATNVFRTQTERVSSAKFGEQIAKYELEQAQAALTFSQSDDPSPETVRFDVVSPINGRVLRVLQESAAVVQPGTPLLELGDTTDLEVEVDVLSTDAVQIQPGARVSVEHWGGEKPLNGFVQLIEPSGFTRVSALGVEEQRVNVIIKFDEPLERRQGLGDAFRVEARIVIWEADDIIKLPTSALFRDGDDWAVFVATDGKAQLRHVEIGHRNSQEAEVVSGLKAGEVVIEHPADQIRSGVLIVPRGEEPTQGSD